MIRILITAATLSVTWILWSWHFEPIVVAFGVASVGFTTWMIHHLGILDAEGQPFELNIRLLAFVPWLAWQVVLSSIQAAKIILSPTLRIRPHLIRVPAPQRTTLGQVIYANTITITPGTIALDVRDDAILVHVLTDEMASEESSSATARIIRWLEAKITHDVDTHPEDNASTASPTEAADL